MADYAGKVRLVFRDYPLPFHEHAQKASEASHCAEAQDKYWPMHDALFANQDKLDVVGLKKLAAMAGTMMLESKRERDVDVMDDFLNEAGGVDCAGSAGEG